VLTTLNSIAPNSIGSIGSNRKPVTLAKS